jgi:hypothetical protein
MTLKILLITGIACTLIAGQSYAQTSQNSKTENKNTLKNNAEQSKRTAPYMQLGDIKGESTKKVSGKNGKRKNAQIGKWSTVDANGKRVGRNPQQGATTKSKASKDGQGSAAPHQNK